MSTQLHRVDTGKLRRVNTGQPDSAFDMGER